MRHHRNASAMRVYQCVFEKGLIRIGAKIWGNFLQKLRKNTKENKEYFSIVNPHTSLSTKEIHTRSTFSMAHRVSGNKAVVAAVAGTIGAVCIGAICK